MNDFSLADTYLYKLHLLSNNLDKIFHRTLRSHSELGLTQFMVLLAVRQYQPVNQRRIASFLMLSPAAISRQVELARKRNWLNVQGSKEDRRGQVLELTARGTAEINKGLTALEEHVFKIFKDDNNSTGLMQHIDALLANMKGIAEEQRGQTYNERLKKGERDG